MNFIYTSNSVKNTEELELLFREYIGNFGFNHFVAGEVAVHPDDNLARAFGQLSNYSPEWLSRYQEMDYIDCDPVYRLTAEGSRPFTWDEAKRRASPGRAQQMMGEAAEYGMRSGLGLSLCRPSGALVGFGFASPERDTLGDKNSQRVLQLASYQFYLVHSELRGIDPRCDAILSARELEVLAWIADGKSKAEIADILMVSESCIKRHCESISTKLGTNTLAASVAKAIRLGLIP